MCKKIMHFKSLDEEMEFWDTHDATDFEAKEVTVEEIIDGLRRCSQNTQVTLRLEAELLNQIKTLAARRGISYSSLIRELLWQGVKAHWY
jgi:predicted DNA binding CopG/RHH family protein